MKNLVAILAAIVVAMAIGYGVWKHEQWVQAKNQCLGVIHHSYNTVLNASGDLDTQIAISGAANKSAIDAARQLVAIFGSKILPLSKQDKRDLDFAWRIVAKDDFDRDFSRLISAIES